jgi:hypothetical protein
MSTLREPTHNLHIVLRVLFYGIIALGVVYYASFQSRELLAGPYIAFDSPINGEIVSESMVTITGSAERIAFLRLNGRQIFVDENGMFEEKLPLLPGHNIMELRATDRFGRITTEKLYLTYTEE